MLPSCIADASRGFRLEIAREALARGDRVVTIARKPEAIEATRGRHDNLLRVVLDVTNEAHAVAAADPAISRFGGSDVPVNNAGYGLVGAVEESSAREVENQFATEVFGLLHVTRTVLPHMLRAHRGLVIIISSIGGYAAYAGWGVYGATRFAVEGLPDALTLELAPLGIHPTLVEPACFRMDFLDSNSLVRIRLSQPTCCRWGQTRSSCHQPPFPRCRCM
jgi:NAD(P)-dependent dehydrogenase (short-subunit alcohol dehydrogenase family)